MLDGLTAFFMESYTNSTYAYALLVLALVVGCAAGLGALTEFITHRLNTRRGR